MYIQSNLADATGLSPITFALPDKSKEYSRASSPQSANYTKYALIGAGVLVLFLVLKGR